MQRLDHAEGRLVKPHSRARPSRKIHLQSVDVLEVVLVVDSSVCEEIRGGVEDIVISVCKFNNRLNESRNEFFDRVSRSIESLQNEVKHTLRLRKVQNLCHLRDSYDFHVMMRFSHLIVSVSEGILFHLRIPAAH